MLQKPIRHLNHVINSQEEITQKLLYFVKSESYKMHSLGYKMDAWEFPIWSNQEELKKSCQPFQIERWSSAIGIRVKLYSETVNMYRLTSEGDQGWCLSKYWCFNFVIKFPQIGFIFFYIFLTHSKHSSSIHDTILKLTTSIKKTTTKTELHYKNIHCLRYCMSTVYKILLYGKPSYKVI